MKKIYAVFISGLSVLAFSSCEGFLDKFPETSLSPETFYTSEKELELATNGFYTMLPSPDNTRPLKKKLELKDRENRVFEHDSTFFTFRLNNRFSESYFYR